MIDTHVHLDMDHFNCDLDLVINNANFVKSFIIPGASLSTISNAINISKKYNSVYFASGLHPNDVCKNYTSNLELVGLNSILNKCVAIGECGLDFYYLEMSEVDKIDRQIRAFIYQIELALKNNLPLILHIRDNKDNFLASQKVCEILSTYKHNKNLRGVFHCFNAYEDSLNFSDTFYYGIGGIITFKNSKLLSDILPRIKDRIILETDAPFLAPIPNRGKRNEPKFLIHIAEKIAEILNISYESAIKLTTNNARKLFNI